MPLQQVYSTMLDVKDVGGGGENDSQLIVQRISTSQSVWVIIMPKQQS